ncbi:hypothetical protein SOV_26470 [Sporomusa ovata DSM 2662]|uniref:Uncharacterized protein n=1 Tax=Sporomusa ovata TaxID=2378 RepID=A0A0U1L4A8_9FIRM|nr:hypothetical protein [Sporomusa ovata]EQB25960.1 hypothetical protein SOV_4c06270 [Sporomusa ovata DSM 2662]CQR74541.1 hypothetical protein SpAn4DRAFT_1003 [Sporomusa ovata]
MLPLHFAIELETAINSQLTKLAAPDDIIPVITLIHNCQMNFLELLSAASTVNIDIAPYPLVTEDQLLGSDASWQQLTLHTNATNVSLQVFTTLWPIYMATGKTVQFYQQAAVNSAQPQTRLFFSSLSHVKKILCRRLDGIIQIYNNHYWGELGFAPFVLGKD